MADSRPSELTMCVRRCMCPSSAVFPPWEARGAGARGWCSGPPKPRGCSQPGRVCLSEIPHAAICQSPLRETDTLAYSDRTPTGPQMCVSKVGTRVYASRGGPRRCPLLWNHALYPQGHLKIPNFPVVGSRPYSHLPGPSVGETGDVFHNRGGLCSPHLWFLYCVLMKPCFFLGV